MTTLTKLQARERRHKRVRQAGACGVESRGCLSDALLEIDEPALEDVLRAFYREDVR